MVSTTAIFPVLVAFLAALPAVNARGCYTGGLAFNKLHGGGGHDLRQEVKNDINLTCRFLDGKVFKEGEVPYRKCTNWAKTFADNGRKPSGFNHINWEVKLDITSFKKQKTMTYEICKEAFEKESGACSTGSEQIHDGFWFRIDPNTGSC